MTVSVHPFPSRTRQLSSLVPTILGWKRPGKIGRCQHEKNSPDFGLGSFFLSSDIFILPAPANSHLDFGAELQEYAPTVHIRAVALKLTVCGRRFGWYTSRVSFGVLEYGAIAPYSEDKCRGICRATASGTGKIGRWQHEEEIIRLDGLTFYLYKPRT